jgi:hypothetical protein
MECSKQTKNQERIEDSMTKINMDVDAFKKDMVLAGVAQLALGECDPSTITIPLLRKLARVAIKTAMRATTLCNGHVQLHPEDEDPEFQKELAQFGDHDLMDKFCQFLVTQHPKNEDWILEFGSNIRRDSTKPLPTTNEGFAI